MLPFVASGKAETGKWHIAGMASDEGRSLLLKLKRCGKTIFQMKKTEVVPLIVFSALFALSVVLSNHIVVGESYYALSAENYISPYGAADAIHFACLFVVIFLVAAFLYALWSKGKRRAESLDIQGLRIRPLALTAVVVAVLHLPYLLAYYPGFIFIDSQNTIAQALGMIGYSNHHPVVYTLFVKLFIGLAHALGCSTTAGCALYSLVQTVVMGFSYATIIQWVMQRLSLGWVWRLFLVALFGVVPYIATYSIAMWKDPLFSAALAVVSVLVADFILTNGKIARTSKLWLPLFAACCLAVALLRSNGFLVDALLCVALVVYVFAKSQVSRRLSVIVCLIPASAIVFNLLLVGPVYNALGVTPNEKVEGLSIPLAQMSRVVAYNGNMSQSDQDYMNELLPLEEYAQTYTPTLIDTVKWSPQFNSALLEDNFFGHWASMMVKNPGLYFEAWEMQTFGFWAVNHPAVIFHTENISAGVPGTVSDPHGANSYGIYFNNYLGQDAQSLLPYENLTIPISWITWVLLFLCLIFLLSGNARWLVPLLPSVALVVSLLVASPIWYWERYAAAIQFLLPFYVALLLVVRKAHSAEDLSRSSSGSKASL